MMSDDWDDVYGQDATPVEETLIGNILAQRKRINEGEQAIANMQREYDKRGKRIAELEAGNQRLRLEVAHANDTTDAAIERIEELEAELAGAINVAYGVSEAAGKRRGELEAKLAKVEDRLFNCAMDLNIYMDLVEKLQEELDNRERSNELRKETTDTDR